MNLIRCLIEALNPCVHQFRLVATMYDNKDDPKITTLVSDCEICGITKRDVYGAEGVCVHKWLIQQKINIMGKQSSPSGIPLYHAYILRCERCGELKREDMK